MAHEMPPGTPRATLRHAAPLQPAATPTEAQHTPKQHTTIPLWMQHATEPTHSSPTRGHNGTHQGDTREDQPDVRPDRHCQPEPKPSPLPLPPLRKDTPQPHTAAPRLRVPDRGQITPVASRHTGLPTQQTRRPARGPQAALFTPLGPLAGGLSRQDTTRPHPPGYGTPIPRIPQQVAPSPMPQGSDTAHGLENTRGKTREPQGTAPNRPTAQPEQLPIPHGPNIPCLTTNQHGPPPSPGTVPPPAWESNHTTQHHHTTLQPAPPAESFRRNLSTVGCASPAACCWCGAPAACF